MADFTFDPANPLAKMPGEKQRANDALRDYYAMGSGRSLRGLTEYYSRLSTDESPTRIPTKNFRTISIWSSKFSWVARIEAQRALDLESEKSIWEERRKQIRESDWSQGVALRDLANKVMAEGVNFIKTRRRVVKGSPRIVDQTGRVLDPGTPEQIIVTMALDGGFLVKAAVTGSELSRLAAEMTTNRQALDVDVSGSMAVNKEVDYGDLSDNQLARLVSETAKFLMALSSRTGDKPSTDASAGADTPALEAGDSDP